MKYELWFLHLPLQLVICWFDGACAVLLAVLLGLVIDWLILTFLIPGNIWNIAPSLNAATNHSQAVNFLEILGAFFGLGFFGLLHIFYPLSFY